MEVTKEKVLESIGTYCTERKYGSETLTDGFKEKFSNFFVKKYAGKDVEEADVISDLHFNLDTAFNSVVDVKSSLDTAFATKENDYKTQIAELNKKLGTPPPPKKVEIPEELQKELEELKKFKESESKKERTMNILRIAKEGIRQDLHKSFESFAEDFDVNLEKNDKEQAEKLVSRFQAIFMDSIGDIKPLTPRQVQQNDDEFLKSVPKLVIG